MPVLSFVCHLKYVCTVDFKVASSIYRKPWLIESHAAVAYADLLIDIREGKGKFEKPKATQRKLFANFSDVVVAPDNKSAAKDHPGYDGKTIAILPISGPLMKEDYCGWYGTDSLHAEFKKIKNTESVKQIFLIFDSPGGQVDGIQPFADSIGEGNVTSIVTGTLDSAAYFLASQSKQIFATAQTDVIGSIGTLVSFYDRSQYLEENGYVLREYTATASKDKTKMMRNAEKGDGKLLVEQLLDPTNDIFLNYVRKGRGEKLDQKETLTGKIFLADKAIEVGLIDGIQSMDSLITGAIQKHTKSLTMKFSLKATFVNILAFLGVKAEDGKESVELSEEQLGKIEAALPELATTKQKVTDLEAAAKKDQATITAITKERDDANVKAKGHEEEIGKLKAEVERLGKLDAGKVEKPKAEADKHADEGETKVDAMAMDFQKDLLNRV
jgi:ClpP class serine protease